MITALFLLGTLTLPQQPQDNAAAANLYLKKADGETISASLVSLQGDTAKLKVSILGGNMTVTHKLADFEPASAFRIELAAAKPADFDGHFAMARKAGDMGLVTQAGAEARAAIDASKDAPDAAEKKAQVRAWAADALEKVIADHVAKGNLNEARQCLKLLTTRLADQRTEEQIDAIAASVEGLGAAHQKKKAAEKQQRLDAKQRESIARALKPIEDNVAKGDADYKNAVRKSRSTTASARLCESAIEHYKKAYKAMQALLEKNPEDLGLADTAASLGKEMHDNAIRAALHAANMLCVQSDYKSAMDWTQRILSYDPENAEAQAMARTITMAQASASDDWNWGWNIGTIGTIGDGPSQGPKPRSR